MFGQGLDLFDIDIGKRQFGFKRTVISNPLDPIYSSETEDLSHKSKNLKFGIKAYYFKLCVTNSFLCEPADKAFLKTFTSV